MNKARLGLAVGAAAFTAACGWFRDEDDYEPHSSGGVNPRTGSNPPPDAEVDHEVSPDASVAEEEMPTSLFVVGSNFERGDARGFDLLTDSFFGTAISVSGDAVGRVYEGNRWVLNRGLSFSSFQGYRLESNISSYPEIVLGQAVNAQDIVVKEGRAYISLHETGEVVVYDLASFMPVDWHNLVRYTFNDGDRRPRPAPLLEIGAFIVVGVQDLPTDLLNPANYTAPAKLVVLNTVSGALEEEVIELPCSNVVALAYQEDGDTLYASCAGTYDTGDSRGGIAAVRFGERRVIRMIHDERLGGTPGPLAVGAGYVFTTAGFSPPTVVRVGADLMGEALEIFASNVSPNGTGWIPAIRWADDRLVIADRDPNTPGLYFSSADGSEQEGPFTVEGGLPPLDLYPY